MKEKETYPYQFREQWENDREILISRIARKCSSALPDNGTVLALRLILKEKRELAKNSKTFKEWESRFPRPLINRDQFIALLAARVAALEAALAEKGGSL